MIVTLNNNITILVLPHNGDKRYYIITVYYDIVHESSVHDIVWNTDFNVFRGWSSVCDSFYWACFTWAYAGFSITHISSGLIMSSYIGSSGVLLATHFLLITQKLRTKIAPERTRLRIIIIIIIIISKVFPAAEFESISRSESVLLKPVCIHHECHWLYWIRILLY